MALVADRLIPTKEKCPNCKKKKVRMKISTPYISYEGTVSALQKAGDGWKEVQQKIIAKSGRHHTIRTK